MPIRKKDYPPNWATEIVPAIRSRAGEQRDAAGTIVQEARCEWCGAKNHSWIIRLERPLQYCRVYYAGIEKEVPFWDFLPAQAKAPGAIKIVHTTSHLDRNRENNAPENLASLCQRCHLNHDRKAQHIPNRAYGIDHSRQPKLF